MKTKLLMAAALTAIIGLSSCGGEYRGRDQAHDRRQSAEGHKFDDVKVTGNTMTLEAGHARVSFTRQ